MLADLYNLLKWDVAIHTHVYTHILSFINNKDSTCGSSMLEISGNNMLTKIMFKGGLPVQITVNDATWLFGSSNSTSTMGCPVFWF